MIQHLNLALFTLASVVALVIVIAAWVVTAAVHERHQRKAHIGAIEQHLADVAERTAAPQK